MFLFNISLTLIFVPVQSFPGHDRFGRPVLFENTGDMDVISLCEKKKIDVETLMRYHIKQQEYLHALMVEASDRFEKPLASLLIIMDIKHATLKTHLNKYSREFFSALANVDQNHYPETIVSAGCVRLELR